MELGKEYKIDPCGHLGLVAFIANKFGNTLYDPEDLRSVGAIGLIKAARTFDPTIAKWTTYASRCITNEILMMIRREKKHVYQLSLDDSVPMNKEDCDITFHDVIHDHSDFYEEWVLQTNCKEILDYASKNLRGNELKIYNILLEDSDLSQYEIGIMLNLSQSYISRLINKIKVKMVKKMERVS